MSPLTTIGSLSIGGGCYERQLGHNNDSVYLPVLYFSPSEQDTYRIWYGQSVKHLLTPYNGEPCTVYGDDGVPLETDDSPNSLSTQNTNVWISNANSINSTPLNSWSAFSTPAGATNETSPSTVAFTPSPVPASQNTAAHSSPALEIEGGEINLDVPAPIASKFQCPHCPEQRNARGLLR